MPKSSSPSGDELGLGELNPAIWLAWLTKVWKCESPRSPVKWFSTIRAGKKWKACVDGSYVQIWGPDSLSVPLTQPTWKSLTENLGRCQYCGTLGKPVSRLGFAGRSCDDCKVKLAPQLEPPGWNK